MNYLVQFDDVRQMLGTISSGISTWNEQLGNTKTAIDELAALESFQGKGAEAAKAYFSEVHGVLYQGITAALTDFLNKYILYQENYYEIDTSIHAKLAESVMEQGIREYNGSKAWLEEIDEDIAGVLQSISDIAYIPQPAIGSVQYAYDSAVDYIRKLEPKVTDYESQVSGSDIAALRELIRNTRKAVQSYLNASGRNVSAYQSGDLAKNDAILAMAESFAVAAAYSEAHQSELEDACGHLEEISAELQKEAEEEAAKERTDAGVAQVITGGLVVFAGACVIVGTAGLATPVVATGIATVSVCTCAYGAAEISEGVQETIYGVTGNLDAESWNPIRDTIFGGNQTAYSIWGLANTTLSSLCVPYLHGAYGKTGIAALKAGVKCTMKEMAADQVMDFGAGVATNLIMNATGSDSETLEVLLNSGLNIGLNRAWDDISSPYSKLKKQIKCEMTTNPDSACLWSGLGKNGEFIAKDYAAQNGLETLGMELDEMGVYDLMPKYESTDPVDVMYFNDTWNYASETFVESASGDFRVLLKNNSFSDTSTFSTAELPKALKNSELSTLIGVDCETGTETIFTKGDSGFVNESTGENITGWSYKGQKSSQSEALHVSRWGSWLGNGSVTDKLADTVADMIIPDSTDDEDGGEKSVTIQVQDTKISTDTMNDLLTRATESGTEETICVKPATSGTKETSDQLNRLVQGTVGEPEDSSGQTDQVPDLEILTEQGSKVGVEATSETNGLIAEEFSGLKTDEGMLDEGISSESLDGLLGKMETASSHITLGWGQQ